MDRWYDSAFGPDYLTLYAHRDAAEARAQVERLIEWGFGGALIDLGCGAGRHVAVFADRGHDAYGVDRSVDLLAAAPRELRTRLVRGDLRELPFRDNSFDGALSLFSSFGYFGPAEDAIALAEAARVLRPGGRLLLDLADPASVRATLVPRSERKLGTLDVLEERRLEQDGRLVIKRVTITDAGGQSRSWEERLQLYETIEIAALAEPAGLVIHSQLASWGLDSSQGTAARQVFFLESCQSDRAREGPPSLYSPA